MTPPPLHPNPSPVGVASSALEYIRIHSSLLLSTAAEAHSSPTPPPVLGKRAQTFINNKLILFPRMRFPKHGVGLLHSATVWAKRRKLQTCSEMSPFQLTSYDNCPVDRNFDKNKGRKGQKDKSALKTGSPLALVGAINYAKSLYDSELSFLGPGSPRNVPKSRISDEDVFPAGCEEDVSDGKST